MGQNLGEPLKEFRHRWEEVYLLHRGKCGHHDWMYELGWIPLVTVPYYPARDRFFPTSNLSKKIVSSLETKQEFIFRDHCVYTINRLEKPLKEIMGHIPRFINNIIADYYSSPLRLDRQALTFRRKEPNPSEIQWYLSR
ncbi:MAG: hypothetical protein KKF46_02375 [Nanoarchaeota archaeon]|nr:hypothetical protein [Nanoarchaeota archaeon]MBU1321178.1 hypothetical protein [Nanoarchaeota archaeon]MBU1598320.1 hypothetical protein [Nanoarchaeota archaeon]MBU2441104.1 hypothetical protein [Nanoarchaeota archaeon]